jgi:hypothetical protein
MASPFAIELSLRDPTRLFESAHPTLLGPRELDPQVLGAIAELSRTAKRGDSLQLVLRFPAGTNPPSDEICRALREYFAWRSDADRHKISRILRDGRFALLTGLGFMVVVNAIAELIHATFAGRFASGLVAGLEIFGWVALWRPAELLLYDWAPAYRRRRLMRRLSEATIECVADRPATF